MAEAVTKDSIKLELQSGVKHPPSPSAQSRRLIKARHTDLLFEDLALCGLRVAEVHQLIKEFVNEHKIVSNALFFQLLEVFTEHLRQKQQVMGLSQAKQNLFSYTSFQVGCHKKRIRTHT